MRVKVAGKYMLLYREKKMITSKAFWMVLLLLVSAAIPLSASADQKDCPDSNVKSESAKSCSDPCSAKSETRVDSPKKIAMGYCSTYQACSIDRELREATPAELEQYKREKQLDGKMFTNHIAPAFEAAGTDGKNISLVQFHGRPVALLFLAVHCSHSLDILPIVSRLKTEYESQDLVLLPVYVHTGTIDDLKTFAATLNLEFPLYMVEKHISIKYENNMVPAMFLIDRKGHLEQRFMGFKKYSVCLRRLPLS